MKPDYLDEVFSKITANGEGYVTRSGKEQVLRQTPQHFDYLLVLTCSNISDEMKVMRDFAFFLQAHSPENVTLEGTDQRHVYIITFNFEKDIRRGNLQDLFKLLSDYFSVLLYHQSIKIQTYRWADIFYNDNQRIEIGEYIYNEVVSNKVPLKHDFISAIVNHLQDNPCNMKPLIVNSKDIHCK